MLLYFDHITYSSKDCEVKVLPEPNVGVTPEAIPQPSQPISQENVGSDAQTFKRTIIPVTPSNEQDLAPMSAQTELVTPPEKGTTRELVQIYVENKTSNPEDRDAIYSRAAEFGQDSPQLGADLASKFDELSMTIEVGADIQTVQAEFIQKLTDKTKEQLKGQESKQENAAEFIRFATETALQLVNERAAEMTPEQLQQQITDNLQLVSMAVEAISFQDLAANAVTLGDHGWHHLYQDMRDSLIIAEGLSQQGLSTRDKLIISLTAAFHDIGYASSQVNAGQRETSANYGLDKGHPLLSFVFLQQNEAHFKKVLTDEEFRALSTIVVNHENPERAAAAGPAYEPISKAFAHADAGASVGKDKVPPIIAQVPEVLSFVYLLNQASVQLENAQIDAAQYDQLVGTARQEVISKLQADGRYDADQATRLLNVFTDTHLNKKSLDFILGRLTGEMGPVAVEITDSGEKRVVLEMNLGEAATVGEFLPGAKEAGAKLAVKVFSEQAGIKWQGEQEASLRTFLLEDTDPILAVADTNIIAMRNGESVILQTPTVKVVYNPHIKAQAQEAFYSQIKQALQKGNQELTDAVNSKKAEER